MTTANARIRFNERGFGLIEIAILLIIFAIGTGVVLQSMTSVLKSARTVESEREMAAIATAIVGDPAVTNDGIRASFGFVGDCGVFPTTIDALRTNSDNIPTWNGPYVLIPVTQDSTSWKTDGWGVAYTLSSSININSTGSGATITKKVADATGDYLLNSVPGTITDNTGSVPGSSYKDSIRILVTVPTGAGGNVTKSYTPTSSGSFTLDSIPAGKRLIRAVLLSRNDTVKQLFTVMPRHKSSTELAIKFGSSYFAGSGGSGSTSTMTLYPNGNGSTTGLGKTGTATNWDAVNDLTPDDNTSYVSKTSTAASDSYAMEDPPTTTGTITKITLMYRVKTGAGSTAYAKPRVYVSGSWYDGTEVTTPGSWFGYSQSWFYNPQTGVNWSWTDITNLQPGIQLRGSGASDAAWCTSLYVVVEYQ